MDNIDYNKIDVRVNEENLQRSFKAIRDEFEDHLSAINGNTLEIKEVYDKMNFLDLKIDKLAEKLETVYMMFTQTVSKKNKYKNTHLSSIEQKVFLATYLEEKQISFTTLSKKLGIKRHIIKLAIESMKRKELPFFSERQGDDIYVLLEPGFRELQTKEQLIKIDEENLKNLYVRDLRFFF